MKTIERYEELQKEFPGLGRPIAIKLSQEFTHADLIEAYDYGVKADDISIKNVFITAVGFKRNNITQ